MNWKMSVTSLVISPWGWVRQYGEPLLYYLSNVFKLASQNLWKIRFYSLLLGFCSCQVDELVKDLCWNLYFETNIFIGIYYFQMKDSLHCEVVLSYLPSTSNSSFLSTRSLHVRTSEPGRGIFSLQTMTGTYGVLLVYSFQLFGFTSISFLCAAGKR